MFSHTRPWEVSQNVSILDLGCGVYLLFGKKIAMSSHEL